MKANPFLTETSSFKNVVIKMLYSKIAYYQTGQLVNTENTTNYADI